MDEDRQVITSGQTRAYDQSFTVANSLRVFSTVKSPCRFSAGEVVGVANISRDITDRKRMEEALCKTHRELELRVEERTEELRKAYEKLKEETQEREKAEAQLLSGEIYLSSCASGTAIRWMLKPQRPQASRPLR
jgi:C4-dicarboxylate-specific signal transduction histidine kinase